MITRHRIGSLALVLLGLSGCSGHLDREAPGATTAERRLRDLDASSDGILGACVGRLGSLACVNGERAMPMQSVVKILVAIAALDAVDRGAIGLGTKVTVRKSDLSISVQPLAALVTDDGFMTSWGDLIRRAIADSDSAATDFIIARLGGVAAVQRALAAHRLSGVRIDRDERHLQVDVLGIGPWRIELSDQKELERTITAASPDVRDRAWLNYRQDPRDTATPRGLATVLLRLQGGQLLSVSSTRFLLEAMRSTGTFPDRLRAGTPPDWSLGHKTGSSGRWRGLYAATNDVGLLYPPSGKPVVAVAFLADSKAAPAEQAAAIASVARIAASVASN